MSYYQDRKTTLPQENIARDSHYYASRLLTFLPELHTSWNGTILEGGCGFGKLVLGIKSILPQATITGIEINRSQVEQLQEYIEKTSTDGLTIVQGDVLDLPFADSSFDIVISEQIIEHVAEQDLLIRQAHRVLKPGGIFVLTTATRLFPWEFHINLPFIPWLSKRMARRILRLAGKHRLAKYYEHVFPISSATLERLLRQTGFEKVEFRGDRWFTPHFLPHYRIPPPCVSSVDWLLSDA